MKLKNLSETLSVTEQVELADISKIANLGFRSIICNRPDGEAANQPGIDQIRTVAEAVDVEIRYIPVVINRILDEDVAEFAKALNELPGPTLAYCRTGMRSSKLWSLAQGERSTLSMFITSAKTVCTKIKDSLQ